MNMSNELQNNSSVSFIMNGEFDTKPNEIMPSAQNFLLPNQFPVYRETTYEQLFREAVEIAEKQRVVYYYFDENIGVYQVSTGTEIVTVLRGAQWCSCPEWEKMVFNHTQTCPHEFACMISEALGTVNKYATSREHISQILCNTYDFLNIDLFKLFFDNDYNFPNPSVCSAFIDFDSVSMK